MAESDNEIHSLIKLIDDPDEGIFEHVRTRIVSLGDEVVPELERAWELDDLGDLFRDRIEDMLHTIHLGTVEKRLTKWLDEGAEDLLEGAMIVSRYRYVELDEQRIRAKLAAVRQDIWLELNDHLTAFEKIRVFNHIFFQVHGFKGNKKNYHAPKNSYINDVLDSHKGNPLSLSIVYQVIAQELGLPLRGVNLPNHFVLAYSSEETDTNGDAKILFYINAFSQGDILGKNEIDEFLAKLGLPAQESFYTPCTNVETIRRQVSNLINSYQKLGDPERVADLEKLRKVLGE